ncbi:MAG: uncharacterized selenium metabolism protein YedF [Candidatus Desulfovibrio kirbyi]|uniref:Uncharacterized selenium metabolism protein YedF n=1 Tax=Candidatus Desulfovibrio kirbyi TaxID=2696086 RepID=A0A6L2R6Q7_9BACT|nr:MAG: uncharacterized selenium metabolism protein YedF [Candidatus Desulfovibrio kirbyi]
MMEVLDCKNLDCPEPVLRTRKHIAEKNPEAFAVMVDNMAACENVTRYMQAQHYSVARTETGGVWRLDGVKNIALAQENEDTPLLTAQVNRTAQKILVTILSDVLGSGDDILGGRLIRNFLDTLPEMGDELWRIILLNGGVKLCVEESPVLEQLRALEKNKVGIFACGACLDYYEIREKQAVGQITNMLDVVTAMQLADKVLRV